MKIHEVKQGSEEWHALRLSHFTASEAPAMLGISKYQSRDDLLREKATKDRKEVNPYLQKIFDKGHAAEAGARPIVETSIGEELYPIVGTEEIDGLPLLASFDGLTMLHDLVFEHKLINEELRKCQSAKSLDEMYLVQMEQQLRVSGADKAIFVASDGTDDDMIAIDYERDDKRWKRILAGWKQFKTDLDNYSPATEEKPAPKAEAITDLPALVISVKGEIKESNLTIYEETAAKYIAEINTDLQTDADFVNAKEAAKFCRASAKQLELVKKQALAQMASVDAVFKTVDKIMADLNGKGLELEKLYKAEQTNRKSEIVAEGQKKLNEYIADKNKIFNQPYIAYQADFFGAGKGLSSLKSYQGAINNELAAAKILVDEQVEKTTKNLGTLQKLAGEYRSLFPDLAELVKKEPADFTAAVKARISDHEAELAAKEQAAREAGAAQQAAAEQRQAATARSEPVPEKQDSLPLDLGNERAYFNFRAGEDIAKGQLTYQTIDANYEKGDGSAEIRAIITIKDDERMRNFILEYLQSLELK